MQAYDVAERVPEPLLDRTDGEHSAIASRIQLITRAATCHEIRPVAGPLPCCEAAPKRPVGQCEQVVAHRHVEMSPAPRALTFAQREHDVHHCWIRSAGDIRD